MSKLQQESYLGWILGTDRLLTHYFRNLDAIFFQHYYWVVTLEVDALHQDSPARNSLSNLHIACSRLISRFENYLGSVACGHNSRNFNSIGIVGRRRGWRSRTSCNCRCGTASS
jgi:hypothetical protein